MNPSDNTCQCPVCGKYFAVESIVFHVDKCLFLSAASESQENNSIKRKAVGEPSSIGNAKSQKLDVSLSQSDSSDSDVQVEMTSHRKPLAEEMRPKSFDDYVGQVQMLGPGSLMRKLIQVNEIPNMILWGPPGSGKTTFATIIQKKCQGENLYCFYKKSATNTCVSELKSLIESSLAEIEKNLHSFKKRTILFLDEIHRFSKSQQDILLPYIENGDIVLIGATTENPSYSLNSALLSRCKVIIFEKLSIEEVKSILLRAANRKGVLVIKGNQIDTIKEETPRSLQIEEEAIHWLAEMCDGDARIALTGLEMALNQSAAVETNRISLQDIKEGVKKSHVLYEKKGDEHYHLISALHKSIRACDDNGAIYWLVRMLEGGEDPTYIARRLVRAAAEDVGMSDHMALSMAVSAMHACQNLGMPDSELILAELVVYLARTDKSTEVYHAFSSARSLVKNHKGPLPGVPLHLRNATNTFTSHLGYGMGYNSQHRDFSNITYMPSGLECINFFKNTSDP